MNKSALLRAFLWGAYALFGSAQADAAPQSVFNDDQMHTFSMLAAAYTAGLDCNMEVDTAVAARFIRSRLGDGSYNADQVALATFMVVGVEAMHQTIPVDCKTVPGLFGPRGRAIKGLLK